MSTHLIARGSMTRRKPLKLSVQYCYRHDHQYGKQIEIP